MPIVLFDVKKESYHENGGCLAVVVVGNLPAIRPRLQFNQNVWYLTADDICLDFHWLNFVFEFICFASFAGYFVQYVPRTSMEWLSFYLAVWPCLDENSELPLALTISSL